MQYRPSRHFDAQQALQRQALNEILAEQRLYPHFQPIVDLKQGRMLGYEALIRGPKGSLLHTPAALFGAAIREGRQLELERLCRQLSLQHFARLPVGNTLFLNVTASLLSSPGHEHGFTVELLRQLGIAVESIVIELSEQHPFDQQGLTRAAVEHYRSMGFRIAIDDLGTGYSGLKLWSELQPEFVKIDRHFIHRLDQDPVKRAFVRSICQVGRNLGCRVLAEGIEQPDELRVLQQLGIELGQGFLLGRPAAVPSAALTPAQVRATRPSRARRMFQALGLRTA
ncbi:EAL domain-containing protein [Marinobacterium weihaiense]|uniref:EAL domain-containing protein n=1 Tax=Marinobacterium weihaiense TaxID=2851016 RepID=A0ABS6M805_9GAMM|nr:EAL domain-containing protein [Marinobacterium weihaiense]MBV0932413.1 EAL domain-containing protein [Marinobacterium weihaiense]